MKLAELKENYTPTTELETEVLEIILDEASDYDSFESYLEDLLNMGCISGMVGALIYYSDTQEFCKRHAHDVNELLNNKLFECGLDTPYQLFGEKWDKEDTLCLAATNQNLLAWFAYEETARDIAMNLNLEGVA